MAATCRTWEAALTREAAAALLRQLPVLFFPKAEGPSFSCLSCGGALHDLALLPYGITGARLIGSRPSSWWFAATGFLNGHVLSNTATGQQIQVPDSMRFGRGDKIIVVQILAANVSAIPNDQVPAALCYGAALVKRGAFPDVMFWRLHQQIGLSSRSVAFDWARRAADVIHHNGVFKFLTQDERLVFVVPEITDGDLELHADVWAPAVDVPGVEPLEEHIGIDARYLVVSRGELLMLRRYRVMKWWTESFRVYRLERLHLGQSPEEDHYTWVELTELGGRILFVARGCSIAFEVQDFAEYPAAVEGVYFKGDVDEFTDGWCAMETLGRATMLSDCGRWSFPRNNDPYFEIPDQVDGTFEHSAAAWLFL